MIKRERENPNFTNRRIQSILRDRNKTMDSSGPTNIKSKARYRKGSPHSKSK